MLSDDGSLGAAVCLTGALQTWDRLDRMLCEPCEAPADPDASSAGAEERARQGAASAWGHMMSRIADACTVLACIADATQ